MRIGHGSRSHTPGWVVAALITGAVILLPGAAWLQAKEKADEEAAVDPQPVAVASTVIAAAENEGQLLKASIVFLEVPVDWVQKIRPVITSNAEVNDAATIVTTGTRLPNEQSASQASVNQRLPAAVPTTSQWLMDDATLAIVAEWSQGSSDSPVKILNRPQLVMVSGSAASLTIGAEMPFVVAVDAETGQPTVDIRNLGLTCKLTATLPDVDLNAAAEKTHRWVGVHCVLTREDLIKVNETIFTSKTGATTKLQSPVVACHKIEFAMNAALGATFATAFGVKTVDDGQRTTVCLVTVDKMPKSASAQTTQSFDASDEPEFKIEK